MTHKNSLKNGAAGLQGGAVGCTTRAIVLSLSPLDGMVSLLLLVIIIVSCIIHTSCGVHVACASLALELELALFFNHAQERFKCNRFLLRLEEVFYKLV